MSTDWRLRCKICDDTSAEINRGQHIFEEILEVWPHIKAILDAPRNSYVEVSVMAYYGEGQEIFNFLREHYEHPLEFESEYGEREQIGDRP